MAAEHHLGHPCFQVKLVGSTISCEGAHEFGGVAGRGRHNPHVQSYVLATDQVRWDLHLHHTPENSLTSGFHAPKSLLLSSWIGRAEHTVSGVA